MKKVILPFILALCFVACTDDGAYRLIYNNDGTDLLANRWFGCRPLTLDDINSAVDLVAQTGATTYMICTGADYAYYRSKFSRPFCSNFDGTFPADADSSAQMYFRNFQNIEAEGTDIIESSLRRAKEDGMEIFVTYRMNDLHFCDPETTSTVWASDFWRAHPEYWLGEGDAKRGWNARGALDFAFPEVRQHKYDMIAEQLEKYSFIDGYELDFMRFIVYFHRDKGPENAPLMTDLVRRVKAKADSVSAKTGHRIMLSARVPQVWESCVENGLEVDEWVKEGLVDFITLGPHWLGDPAIDAGRFRKDSGIGKHTPIYATIDDGTFRPREFHSHGMYRGEASFALSHGAQGIYLFNYFFAEYVNAGYKAETEKPGNIVSRVRTPELARELGSLKTLEGRNKSICYYSGNNEYGLKYLTPMPLNCEPGKPASMTLPIADKMRPRRPVQGFLIFRSGGDDFKVSFNGTNLDPLHESYALLFDRMIELDGDVAHCFAVPAELLKTGENSLEIECSQAPQKITRLELILDYGDDAGWH